jgi:hypothetical protein
MLAALHTSSDGHIHPSHVSSAARTREDISLDELAPAVFVIEYFCSPKLPRAGVEASKVSMQLQLAPWPYDSPNSTEGNSSRFGVGDGMHA